MLVLTRRIGEVITIGDTITVKVLDVHHNNVRLGIEAPKSIPVHRKEIYERVQRENANKNSNPESN